MTRTLSVDGRGRLNKDKWGETVVARWIYKFIKNLPNLPSNTTVNHRCDNANCVNPTHLYHKEDEEWNESNMKDCVGQGRIPGQVFVPQETQTPWERVAEIRRRILAGARTKDLCKEFNCSKVAIAGIKYNRTYKDDSYTPP